MALSTKATLVLQNPCGVSAGGERKPSLGGQSTMSTLCDSEFGGEGMSTASQVDMQLRDDSFIFHRAGTVHELKLSEIKKIKIRRRKVLFLRQKIQLTTVDGKHMTLTNFHDVQALNAIIDDLEKERDPNAPPPTVLVQDVQSICRAKSANLNTIPERSDSKSPTKAHTTQFDSISVRELSETVQSTSSSTMNQSSVVSCSSLHLFDPTTVSAPSCSNVPLKPRRDKNLKFDPGLEFVLEGVTVAEFQDMFFSNESKGFFKERDVEIVEVTEWQDGCKNSLPRRRVSCITPVRGATKSGYLVPTHSDFTQNQWITKECVNDDDEFHIELEGMAHDVPLGTTFHSIEYWTIKPVPGQKAVEVSVEIGVYYLKRFAIARMYRTMVIDGVRRNLKKFVQHSQQYIQLHGADSAPPTPKKGGRKKAQITPDTSSTASSTPVLPRATSIESHATLSPSGSPRARTAVTLTPADFEDANILTEHPQQSSCRTCGFTPYHNTYKSRLPHWLLLAGFCLSMAGLDKHFESPLLASSGTIVLTFAFMLLLHRLVVQFEDPDGIDPRTTGSVDPLNEVPENYFFAPHEISQKNVERK